MAQIEGITIFFEGNELQFDKTADGVKKQVTLLKRMTAECNKEFHKLGDMKYLEQSLTHLKQQQEDINRLVKYYAETTAEAINQKKSNDEINKEAAAWQQWKNAAIDVEVQIKNVEDRLKEISDIQSRGGFEIKIGDDIQKFDKGVSDVRKGLDFVRKSADDLERKFKETGEADYLRQSIERTQEEQRGLNLLTDYYQDKLQDLKNDSDALDEDINEAAMEWQKTATELEDCNTKLEEQKQLLKEHEEQLIRNNTHAYDLRDSFEQVGEKVTDVGSKIEEVGRQMQRVSGFARDFLKGGIESAGDFSLAFANVVRVLDKSEFASEGNFEYFKNNLEQGIREMATTIPADAETIAESVQLMAQLGIKNDDLLKFSKVMIDLSNTTDLTAEQAGENIAKLYNILGSDVDTVDRFASALLDLGRKSAATESDITEMAFRVSAAGRQMGLSEQEILGLATALSSVGLKAQGGGTAISTVMYNIQKAVDGTAKNSEDIINAFAEATGMSAKQFKQAWGDDVLDTLNQVIVGLYKYEDEGGRLITILDEMGVKNVRQLDALGRLAGKQDSVSHYTELATKAWEENSVLAESTELIYNEFNSKLKVFMDNWEEFKRQIGEALMPVAEQLLAMGMQFLNWLTSLSPETQRLLGVLTAVVGVLSPILIGIGSITKLLGGFLKGGVLGKLATNFGLFRTAGHTAFQSVKLVAKESIIKLITTLGKLINPVTLVIGIFMACYAASEDLRNAVSDLGNYIWQTLQPIIESVTLTFQNVWEVIKLHVVPMFKALGDLLAVTVIPIVKAVWSWFAEHILPAFKTVAEFIVNVLLVAFTGIVDIVTKVIEVVKDLWNRFTETEWFDQIVARLHDLGDAFGFVFDAVDWVIGGVNSLIDGLKEYLGLSTEVEKANRKLSPASGNYDTKSGRIVTGGSEMQAQSGGFGGVTLYNTITVQNTGAAINDAEVQRWGREIADTVNYHLGRML